MSPNLKAFLDMLAFSEIGPTLLKNSDNGYNVLVGGELFKGYADHPRKLVHINAHLESTAAGRYQLLARYFDAYKKQLGLPDFSPDSQDAIACQQIKERGAIPDIEAGRITQAIAKCSNIWASLPGNNYGQHQNSTIKLLASYMAAGGQAVA